jgi:hypothetical protein
MAREPARLVNNLLALEPGEETTAKNRAIGGGRGSNASKNKGFLGKLGIAIPVPSPGPRECVVSKSHSIAGR